MIAQYVCTHISTVKVLAPFFGGMISFVKDNEGYLERGELRKINVNESKIICV